MAITLNDRPSKLKVGDLVTTEFLGVDIHVVRKITRMIVDSNKSSGYSASADGGAQCECCGRIPGQPIVDIDATWFIPVTSPENPLE